jgi:hypothetical protein
MGALRERAVVVWRIANTVKSSAESENFNPSYSDILSVNHHLSVGIFYPALLGN